MFKKKKEKGSKFSLYYNCSLPCDIDCESQGRGDVAQEKSELSNY